MSTDFDPDALLEEVANDADIMLEAALSQCLPVRSPELAPAEDKDIPTKAAAEKPVAKTDASSPIGSPTIVPKKSDANTSSSEPSSTKATACCAGHHHHPPKSADPAKPPIENGVPNPLNQRQERATSPAPADATPSVPPAEPEMKPEMQIPSLEEVMQATARATGGFSAPYAPMETPDIPAECMMPEDEPKEDNSEFLLRSRTYNKTWSDGKSEFIQCPGLPRFNLMEQIVDTYVQRSASLEVWKTELMGLGIKAGRDIEAGEIVLHEKAAIVVVNSGSFPNSFLKCYMDYYGGELRPPLEGYLEHCSREFKPCPADMQTLTSAFNALPFGNRLGLIGAEVLSAMGALQSNNFTKRVHYIEPKTEKPTEASLHCFFPVASLLNHSCTPNLEVSLVVVDIPTKGRMPFGTVQLVCRAKARIQRGAELFVSYLESGQLRKPALHRRSLLQTTRGFECQCESCRSEKPSTLGSKLRFCWRN